jgi:Protein of unknown function (DUF1647)
MDNLTIVTGASSNHFRSLERLLYSLSIFAPRTRTIVYDLGLALTELEELASRSTIVRQFRFPAYPPHVDISKDRGQYAWKPILIHEVLLEFGGLVLWLDAGDLVLSPLARVWSFVARNALVSPRSSGTLRDWTHPGTLCCLNVPAQDQSRNNRNGAVVGLDGDCEWARRLSAEWKTCALQRDCIAPKGSSRKNHRQDQAVLSALYYRYQRAHHFEDVDKLREIAIHSDERSWEEVLKFGGNP